MADFNLEKENFNNNCIMIGVDEAGRGSWAGPVVAASCWINFQNYKLLPQDINDSKKIVSDLASAAPIDTDKVAKIKAAISSGNYPLDLDKISDALMQAYREMKS